VTLPVAACLGLVVGLIAGTALRHRAAGVRAAGLFEAWRSAEASRVSRSAARDGRLATKTLLGTELAGGLELPWMAADAHFLGHPVHLIVFDGDSAVKAGTAEELAGVVFVTIVQDHFSMAQRHDAELIAECVEAGRVRWETIRHPGPI
jgi:hypothetical protein